MYWELIKAIFILPGTVIGIIPAVILKVAQTTRFSPALASPNQIFFTGNFIYFPLVEEKGLEKRFGPDYLEYKANVPRWIHRLRALQQPETTQRKKDDFG